MSAAVTDAFAGLDQRQRRFVTTMQLEDNTLQVQQQVDNVFPNTIQRRVLVQYALDRHFGRRVARQRGEQNPAERIAKRMTEPRSNGSIVTRACTGETFCTSMMRGFSRALLCIDNPSVESRQMARPPLTRIQFDNQTFVQGRRQFRTLRISLKQRSLAGLGINSQPFRGTAGIGGFQRGLDAQLIASAVGELDCRPDERGVGRDIHPLAVDQGRRCDARPDELRRGSAPKPMR